MCYYKNFDAETLLIVIVIFRIAACSSCSLSIETTLLFFKFNGQVIKVNACLIYFMIHFGSEFS